ncbi:ABC transporter permease [Bacteroides faecalis]|uniref:ABC transporter permease n=1 Tax=Bacteroides faecalis TaxID=2447885 RepID=A0A401M0L0_9BACE|nr:ABC transporter permease [Bacteroides faecalis]GCB37273.1 ABC transporter permease [Bacteroides faecalis]
MIKQYLKQVIYQLKENKLISCISIAGTAFTIAMIMVMVILFQIKNANYRPEVNRNRTMYVQFGETFGKADNKRFSTNFNLTLPFIKECLYSLKSAEVVTAMTSNTSPFSVPGSNEFISGRVKYIDTAFWKMFDFEFLAGKPFTEADFQSGIKQVVIREKIAQKLFHTTEVVGKSIHVQGIPYTICGVVRNYSKWASFAHADMFIPYTVVEGWQNYRLQGPFICLILAPNKDAFDAIRRETDANVERFNEQQSELIIGIRKQPYSHFQQRFFTWGLDLPHVAENVRRYVIILLVLLLIPAINLSSLTLSRMQKRMQEIGIRRSFGATRKQIVSQVLSENLIITLLGGLLGLLLSYLGIYLMHDWLLDGDPYISPEMVASPVVFVLAFLFCLILNLLSASIPAWRVARKNITDALR